MSDSTNEKAAAAAANVSMRVLTFNLWGIFNSKMREERMEEFATKVGNYDVILLQEQFSPEDFQLIIERLPRAVRESRYFMRFPSSFYGSGCAVISRYPIKSSFFHTYPLQGYPEMILHGDFFANKGAALIKIEVPVAVDGVMVPHEVLLYTTHLVAIYQKVSLMSSWRKERYLPFRISQAISLAEFIANTSRPTDTIIIGGDFNCSQRSLEVQMLLILLKRRGYSLRSVLPTPTVMATSTDPSTANPADAAGAAAVAAASGDTLPGAGESLMYTFSDRNAHNTSATSYFKLLNMQADIPLQIDHLFFTSGTLALRPFENCPDVSPEFPLVVNVNGTQVPSGLVVFTENQVRPRPRVALNVRLANWLRGLAGNKIGAMPCQVRKIADVISPARSPSMTAEALSNGRHSRAGSPTSAQPTTPHRITDGGGGAQEEKEEHLYPLSDHYGVAALLHFRSSTPLSSPAAEAPGSPLPLTPEEVIVVNSVIQFLDSYASKLRHQVRASRYMTAISVAIVGLNIWTMRRATQIQEARTAATICQLFTIAGNATAQQRPEASGAAAGQSTARGTVKQLFSAFASKLASRLAAEPVSVTIPQEDASASASSKPQLSASDFSRIAHELALRNVWHTVAGSAAISAVGAVVGVGSFLIGMFQRMGNANILEEQVRRVRQA